jgi:hypothetical protein
MRQPGSCIVGRASRQQALADMDAADEHLYALFLSSLTAFELLEHPIIVEHSVFLN